MTHFTWYTQWYTNRDNIKLIHISVYCRSTKTHQLFYNSSVHIMLQMYTSKKIFILIVQKITIFNREKCAIGLYFSSLTHYPFLAHQCVKRWLNILPTLYDLNKSDQKFHRLNINYNTCSKKKNYRIQLENFRKI